LRNECSVARSHTNPCKKKFSAVAVATYYRVREYLTEKEVEWLMKAAA